MGFLPGGYSSAAGVSSGGRSDAARVGEQVALGVDHAEARVEASLEGSDEVLRALRVCRRRGRQRRGEQPRLLDHAALLRAEELVLIDVEVEEAEERQEDEKEVEREKAGADAGNEPHASPSSLSLDSRYR